MLTKQEVYNILSSKIEEVPLIKLPHFSLLENNIKAADFIIDNMKQNKKITVIGDYDVDGVSSSAIMKKFFDFLNYEVEIIIPNRFKDGYGLTPSLLKDINTDLIITVDNGITSFEAVEICNRRGINVIITDHHTPIIDTKNREFKLPDAYAIINPKLSPNFPFKEICGAEVAWYLIAAIKNRLNLEFDLRELLDIVAIATIADVMPLNNINRSIVKVGLKKLNTFQTPYSIALKEFLKKEQFSSQDIAFQVAPRLNSAGRIEDAKIAFQFLTSTSIDEALYYLNKLDELNNLRKEIEKNIIDNIKIDKDENFIVVNGDFHEGVIGIVANKLVSKYKKPALVLTKNSDKLKGSGRSLGNIDIFKLISECKELFESFGGHMMACGVTLKQENLNKLKEKLNHLITLYKEEDFFLKEFIIGEIAFSEIDEELLHILNLFEPFGEGNPIPKFISKAEVESVKNIKDNHFLLVLKQNNIYLPAIIFNNNKEFKKEIEFKFTVSKNSFNNQIQLIIEEFT